MVCGQGAPAYSWYKDGIPLDSSSYIVEEEGRIVVVTNETRDPFGLYTCKTSDVIRQWYLPVQASRGTEVMLWREGGGRWEEGMEGRQKHLFQYSSEYLAAIGYFASN